MPVFRIPFRQHRDEAAMELAEPEAGGAGEATPPLEPGRFANSLRAFQHRNYRLFYTGQSISLIGTWMQTIAQAWLVLEITDSEAALGVVTMLQFLPIMLFVLFAGVVADRVPKRDFLIVTQALAMTQAAILALLVLTDTVQLWHVYVLALMLGLSNAFDLPTRQAFAIEMVGRDDLMNAVALNAGMFNGARLIGPAVGGFIISGLGVEAVFVLNAASFAPVLISLFLMRKSELHTSDYKRSTEPVLTQLREGISYAWRTPAIRMIIIVVALVGTFGYNFTVMIPLLAKYVLGEGSVAFGFLTAAVGCGALISAIILAGRKAATRWSLFAGATAFTVLLGGVALSTNLFVTMALLLGVGVSSTLFATTANTSIQLAAPDHLRARVVSLYMLLFAGSTPIGGLLMGLLADNFGTQWAIGIFAAMCGVGVALGGLYYTTHKSAVVRTAQAQATA
jgi:MFS family permease